MSELSLKHVLQNFAGPATAAYHEDSEFSLKGGLYGGSYGAGSASLRQRLAALMQGRSDFGVYEHGFKFANNWQTHLIESPVHLSTQGRCGGMTYAALDYYYDDDLPIPALTDEPRFGQVLSTYIYERTIQSLWDVVDDFAAILADLGQLVGHPAFLSGINHNGSDGDQLVTLKLRLDAGQPTNLGLVYPDLAKVGLNHQVLAIGYAEGSSPADLKIFLYDPNRPDQEMVLYPDIANNQFREQSWSQYGANNDAALWLAYFVNAEYSALPPPDLAPPQPLVDLSGEDHGGGFFDHADWRSARLVGTMLVGARLRRVDMGPAGDGFEPVNAAGADFSNADMQLCYLVGANLANAKFLGAYMGFDILDNVCAQGAYFSAANLRGAQGQNADFRDAHFDVSGSATTDLSESNFSYAVFADANLSASSSGIVDLKDAVFANADFTRARLKATDSGIVDLRGGDFRGADFTDADLTALTNGIVDLRNSKKRADFQGAKFVRANLSARSNGRVDLRTANFRDADLTDAVLSAEYSYFGYGVVDLRGADFTNANLSGANLSYADATGAIFTGANMTGVITTGTVGLLY